MSLAHDSYDWKEPYSHSKYSTSNKQITQPSRFSHWNPNYSDNQYYDDFSLPAIDDFSLSCFNVNGGTSREFSLLRLDPQSLMPASLTSTIAYPKFTKLLQNSSDDPFLAAFPSPAFDTRPLPLPSTKTQRKPRKSIECQCPNCSAGDGNRTIGLNGKPEHICHVPDCGRVFGLPGNLKRHLAWHSKLKLAREDAIGERVEAQKSKRERPNYDAEGPRKRRRLVKKYLCEYCGKGYSRRDTFDFHVRTSHVEENKCQMNNDEAGVVEERCDRTTSPEIGDSDVKVPSMTGENPRIYTASVTLTPIDDSIFPSANDSSTCPRNASLPIDAWMLGTGSSDSTSTVPRMLQETENDGTRI